MDWSPVAALPLEPSTDATRLDVAPEAVVPFLYSQSGVGDSAASIIPHAREALQGVRVLARRDGFFVYELTIDDGTGFEPNDMDELAYVVSMVIKDAYLRHTHYHHNMPGKGGAQVLKPSQILIVPPVQLEPAAWDNTLGGTTLSDAELKAAKCERCPTGKTKRPALVQFRYRYLRLSDRIAFRIRAHRESQQSVPRSRQIVILGAWSILATSMAMLPVLDQWRSLSWMHIPPGLIILFGVGFAMHFQNRISRWDIPVIRLLRTAHGFYVAAEPLNRVLSAMQPAVHSGGFDHIRENLLSRLEGEEHRIQIGHAWLALCVAICGLVTATAALDLNRRSVEAGQSSTVEASAAVMREIVRNGTSTPQQVPPEALGELGAFRRGPSGSQ